MGILLQNNLNYDNSTILAFTKKKPKIADRVSYLLDICDDLEILATDLWLGENDKMATYSSYLIKAISKWDYIESLNQYTDNIEGLIKSIGWEGWAKIDIAFLLRKASLFLAWWNTKKALEELYDALEYSNGHKFEQISTRISYFIALIQK